MQYYDDLDRDQLENELDDLEDEVERLKYENAMLRKKGGEIALINNLFVDKLNCTKEVFEERLKQFFRDTIDRRL